jgi:pentatricopeptide repeat protein
VYTSLLRGYCRSGRWQDVGRVFEEMSRGGIRPGVVMFNGLIDSLCGGGKASKVVAIMVEQGVQPDVVTCNVLINSLCKEGSITEAMDMRKGMQEKGVTPDVVTYNTLIAGLCGVLEMDALLDEIDSRRLCGRA